MWRGVKFRSGADLPLKVVSGLYYWWTKPVWTDKPALCRGDVSVGRSDNCTGPSLNLIKRNFPQSNVTWPDKSNVVTVFGIKNTTAVRRDASFLPPVLPILLHISFFFGFTDRTAEDLDRTQDGREGELHTAKGTRPRVKLGSAAARTKPLYMGCLL